MWNKIKEFISIVIVLTAVVLVIFSIGKAIAEVSAKEQKAINNPTKENCYNAFKGTSASHIPGACLKYFN